MWLFNAPPTRQLKEKYGFEPSGEWLNHLQKASVRFNSGGSGSFVSADGLCITNHHVGADALQKFGDEQHNYLHDGFYAKTNAEEKPCLDLELNVLLSTEDVTTRVQRGGSRAAQKARWQSGRKAVPPWLPGARSSRISRRNPRTKPACVLMWSLSTRAARTSFIATNGTRMCGWFSRRSNRPLSTAVIPIISSIPATISIFVSSALTKNGQPAHPEQFPQVEPERHHRARTRVCQRPSPVRTARQLTLFSLANARDVRVPSSLSYLYAVETLLTSYSGRSIENARRARDELFGVQNSRKAYDGMLGGLLDPEFFCEVGRQRGEPAFPHRRCLHARSHGRLCDH